MGQLVHLVIDIESVYCVYSSATVHVRTHPSAPVVMSFVFPSNQDTPDTPPGCAFCKSQHCATIRSGLDEAVQLKLNRNGGCDHRVLPHIMRPAALYKQPNICTYLDSSVLQMSTRFPDIDTLICCPTCQPFPIRRKAQRCDPPCMESPF
jgi:hypothetical protein